MNLWVDEKAERSKKNIKGGENMEVMKLAHFWWGMENGFGGEV